MSSAELGKALRDIKFAERLFPTKTDRQLDALSRTVDETGAINPTAISRYRSPQVMSWTANSTIYQRVERAGVITLVSVYALVVPTTADAVISIWGLTEDDPTAQVLARVTIPVNQRFGQSSPMIAAPTGQWMVPGITTSGSGSLFSVSLNITQD